MRKPWSRLFVSCWSYQTELLGTSSGSTNTRLVSGPVPAVQRKPRRCSPAGPATAWAKGRLALAVVFRGAERRLDVGELKLRCRILGIELSRRHGAAIGLAPLDGTGGRATPTFGERAASRTNTKGDHGGGGRNIMVFIGLLLCSDLRAPGT